MKLRSALAACLLAGASRLMAQACLNGPVTQGNLTVVCAQLDASADSGDSGAHALLFQIKVTGATNPNAVGLRIGIAYTIANPDQTQPPLAQNLWVIASKLYQQPGQGAPSYSYTAALNGGQLKISSVTVQELVAATSQTF